jgi:hypothetical protein
MSITESRATKIQKLKSNKQNPENEIEQTKI